METSYIGATNSGRIQQIQSFIEDKATPQGGLGCVEEIALRLALLQETSKPFLNQPSLLHFAGDHGIAEEGVCAFPQLATGQGLLNYAKGGASVCAFARLNRLMLRIVDCGLIQGVDHPQILARRLGSGTQNFKNQEAMTVAQLDRGLRLGGDIVKARCKAGTNILGFGTSGVGGDIAADAILSHLVGVPMSELCDETAEHGFVDKKKILYQDLDQIYGPIRDPHKILQTFGGLEFAMMLGAILQCVQAKAIILVDGYIGSVIALLASRLEPQVKNYLFICQKSRNLGQKWISHELSEPLMNLGMDMDDGSGVALAYPLFQSAVTFLNEVSTYDEAKMARPYFNSPD